MGRKHERATLAVLLTITILLAITLVPVSGIAGFYMHFSFAIVTRAGLWVARDIHDLPGLHPPVQPHHAGFLLRRLMRPAAMEHPRNPLLLVTAMAPAAATAEAPVLMHLLAAPLQTPHQAAPLVTLAPIPAVVAGQRARNRLIPRIRRLRSLRAPRNRLPAARQASQSCRRSRPM
jgi:hypothetical protein